MSAQKDGCDTISDTPAKIMTEEINLDEDYIESDSSLGSSTIHQPHINKEELSSNLEVMEDCINLDVVNARKLFFVYTRGNLEKYTFCIKLKSIMPTTV